MSRGVWLLVIGSAKDKHGHTVHVVSRAFEITREADCLTVAADVALIVRDRTRVTVAIVLDGKDVHWNLDVTRGDQQRAAVRLDEERTERLRGDGVPSVSHAEATR